MVFPLVHDQRIEVLELPDSRGESRCYFDRLEPFNPIWQAIDSLSHKPSDEQLSRAIGRARTLRWPLQENQLHPYTICETPAFIRAPELIGFTYFLQYRHGIHRTGQQRRDDFLHRRTQFSEFFGLADKVSATTGKAP